MNIKSVVKVVNPKSSNYNHVGVISDVCRIGRDRYYVEFGEFSHGLYKEEQLQLLPDDYVIQSLKNEVTPIFSREYIEEMMCVIRMLNDEVPNECQQHIKDAIKIIDRFGEKYI